MKNEELEMKIDDKWKEEKFREHAKTYLLCFSTTCPLREHCLHYLLNEYASKTKLVTNSVNLNNPSMQTENCPHFVKDEPIEMPTGIEAIYYEMPGRIEKKIKSLLIDALTRKRYYAYHGGRLPMPPETEEYVRKVAKDAGWDAPLVFGGTITDYLW